MRLGVILLLLLASLGLRGQSFYDTTIKPADVNINNYIYILKNKKVGLIVNQTSAIHGLSLVDVLLDRKINVKKIFVPEHGFRGTEDAGAKIDNSLDSATHLPVFSLYGKNKKPKPEDLTDIDVLVYDLQDVGARFYTYISTLEYCMEACAENHKKFVVLDRPNPNGFYVDGPVLEIEYQSFVGRQCIPIVYGMTAGEYAQMLKGENWLNKASDLDLEIIPCENYTHAKLYKLPVAPSPNLRTMAAIYAYPTLCLFEGTIISVGRGTDKPFMQFGCPEFEGRYKHTFIPKSGAGAKNPLYENKHCFGEVTGDTDKDVFDNIDGRLKLDWLLNAYKNYPQKEKFFNDFFKKLCGTSLLQTQIIDGSSIDEIRKSWKNNLEKFMKIRKKYLLYK